MTNDYSCFSGSSMVYQLKHQNSINSSNSRENLAHPLCVNNPWICCCCCTEGFVSQTHLKISIFYTKMSHSVNTVSVQASCVWQKIVASGNWKKWKKSFRKNVNFDKRDMFPVHFEVISNTYRKPNLSVPLYKTPKLSTEFENLERN